MEMDGPTDGRTDGPTHRRTRQSESIITPPHKHILWRGYEKITSNTKLKQNTKPITKTDINKSIIMFYMPRQNKNICLAPLTRPYIFFSPDPKLFLFAYEQNWSDVLRNIQEIF